LFKDLEAREKLFIGFVFLSVSGDESDELFVSCLVAENEGDEEERQES
jgi:hypothetical protein